MAAPSHVAPGLPVLSFLYAKPTAWIDTLQSAGTSSCEWSHRSRESKVLCRGPRSSRLYPGGRQSWGSLSCGHPVASLAPIGTVMSPCFPDHLCNASQPRASRMFFWVLIPCNDLSPILYQHTASRFLCVCLCSQKISNSGGVTVPALFCFQNNFRYS